MRRCDRSSVLCAVLSLGFTFLLWAANAWATDVPIPHGTIELIAENQWIAPGRDFYLGLHYQLEKGWHIYWVNPGDSGEPPRVIWTLAAGLTAGAIEWPTPHRLGTSSVVDFGYEDVVTLIVPMHAETNLLQQQSEQLSAEVKVLVCREMCIPGKVQVSLTLPIKLQSPASNSRTAELFATARKALPRPKPANWKFSVEQAKNSFILTANLGHQVPLASFFPLDESQISNATPQKVVPVATGFRMTLQKSDQLLKPIKRLKGVLVLSADRAYLIDVPVGKPGALKNSTGPSIQSE